MAELSAVHRELASLVGCPLAPLAETSQVDRSRQSDLLGDLRFVVGNLRATIGPVRSLREQL